jgi:imidazolonepropionase-like amidohydrolase
MQTIWQDLRYGARIPLRKLGGAPIVTLTLAVALVSLLFSQNRESARSRILAFTHVTVIDGSGTAAKTDFTVVIVGDRIVEVGRDQSVRIPKDAQIINASGKFLIPGLWDMHVHLGEGGEALFPALIANGVTSVREMGGSGEQALALRERVKSGSLLGPRIKSTGLILESPRFIQIVERINGESFTGKRIGVANADDARRAIEANVKMGADFLKIRTSASRDSYLAIAAETKRVGLPLAGHLPDGIDPLEASDAGQRSIEHGWVMLDKIPEDKLKVIAARLIKNNTHVVPTLVGGRGFRETPDAEALAVVDDKAGLRDARRRYVPQSLADSWRKLIEMKKFEGQVDWQAVKENNLQIFRALHRAGVKMMTGTDLGGPLVYPGFGLHDELELLVSGIGLTPAEALQSATRIPAEFMGMGASLGTVEQGKLADLALLEANPLSDIKNTRKIAAVVIGGRFFSKAELQTMLDKMAAEAGKR